MIVTIIHWLIISILVIMVFQMIFTSSYTLLLMKIIVSIRCGLSIVLLAFLAKKFFTWFRSYPGIVVISYAITMSILSVNIFFMAVFVIDYLDTRENVARYIKSPRISVTNADNIFNTIYAVTSTVSFILLWLATVFLLRYYSKKLRNSKILGHCQCTIILFLNSISIYIF